jgi:hypothetical protein
MMLCARGHLAATAVAPDYLRVRYGNDDCRIVGGADARARFDRIGVNEASSSFPREPRTRLRKARALS